MLIRPHDDAGDDDPRWRDFVVRQGFGHFVASGTNRDVAVVVPTQFVLEGDEVVFHLAGPNPVFGALAENPRSVMSIAGDWAYIPGSWKATATEDPRKGVPTTYYGAVQLTGTAHVWSAPDDVAAVLRRQLASLEPDGDYIDPIEHGKRLKAIRAITVTIDEVRAKFKYGGNVDQAHRDHIATLLAERAGPGDAAALTHMERS